MFFARSNPPGRRGDCFVATNAPRNDMLSKQRNYRFTKHLCVIVHICLRGFGRDECHVVEGSHEDAAIEGEEMHVAV